jgi:hypothetical protein
VTSPVLFYWPYGGLVLSLLLFAWLLGEKQGETAPPRLRDPAWLLPLLWPMYLLHQFEEHGIDLYGRHYAFLGDLCSGLGYREGSSCPADPAFIFAVNAVGCQIAFLMSWIFRRRLPLLAACVWGIPIVNAVTHVAAGVARRSYNPGLLTSLVLFVPLSVLVLSTVLRTRTIETRDAWRVIGTGVLVHVVLISSLLLRARGWLTHASLVGVNVANGLTPMVLGTLGLQRSRSARRDVRTPV